jgi:hypothetical protein
MSCTGEAVATDRPPWGVDDRVLRTFCCCAPVVPLAVAWRTTSSAQGHDMGAFGPEGARACGDARAVEGCGQRETATEMQLAGDMSDAPLAWKQEQVERGTRKPAGSGTRYRLSFHDLLDNQGTEESQGLYILRCTQVTCHEICRRNGGGVDGAGVVVETVSRAPR